MNHSLDLYRRVEILSHPDPRLRNYKISEEQLKFIWLLKIQFVVSKCLCFELVERGFLQNTSIMIHPLNRVDVFANMNLCQSRSLQEWQSNGK